jgi:hypothetical protein
MSTVQKYSRVIYHASMSASRLAGITALPQHNVPDALSDGTLPKLVAEADLEVIIPHIDTLTTMDAIILNWNGADIAGSKYPITAPDLVPGVDYTLYLPVAEMTGVGEGRHLLDYTTLEGVAENPAKAFLPLTLIIDRTAPGGSALGPLVFTLATEGVVTDADLNASEQLVATIPNWLGEDTGDVATPEIAPMLVPGPTDWVSLPGSKETVTTVGASLTFKLPKADLIAVDGWQSFSWNVVDKAGNPRPTRAPAVRLRTLLGKPPANFVAPVVPAFVDHGVVTWTDAQGPLIVDIRGYDNPAEDDRVIISWGAQEAPPAIVGPTNPLPDPLISVEMDIQQLIDEGDGTVVINYRVERGIDSFGPSPNTSVLVDLTTPGGIIDPDPTTPEHDNLPFLTVRSSSGQTNTIPPADFDKDGTITIPYRGLDVPTATPIFEVNDTIKISWGPTLKIDAVVTDAAVNQSIPLSSVDIIQKGPTGSFEVSYSVSRDLGVGSPSQIVTVTSKPTTVSVVSSADVPGGGAPLALAVFTEANANNIINKAAGEDGTTIRVILPITNMDEGDKLKLEFVGYYELNDPSGTEIPGTKVNLEHILLATDNTNRYYDFPITENQLKAICQGGATAIYTADNGYTASSLKAFVIISVVASGYCLIPRP